MGCLKLQEHIPKQVLYKAKYLGSTSYMSFSDGEIMQHDEYVPFGEVLLEDRNTAKATANVPYLFNGKELDEETGYYYYGARYYDPKVSNWLSVDPLVEKTMQPYAYAYNNPLKFIDPTGMKGEDWVEDNKGNRYWKDNVTSKNDKDLDKSKGEKWLGKTEASCQGDTCHNFRSDGTIEKNTYNSKTGKTSSQLLANGASSTSGGDTYTSRASNFRKAYNTVMDNVISPTMEGAWTFGLLFYGPLLHMKEEIEFGEGNANLGKYYIPYPQIKDGKLIMNDINDVQITQGEVASNLTGIMLIPISFFGKGGAGILGTTGNTILDAASNVGTKSIIKKGIKTAVNKQ